MSSSKLCLNMFNNVYNICLIAKYKENPTEKLKKEMIFRNLLED